MRYSMKWGGRALTAFIPSHSSLSVIGTWYVTAVIIIKYIWPDKELVPVEIPTR